MEKSQVNKFVNGVSVLREDAHSALVSELYKSFGVDSTLVLGSSPKVASSVAKNSDRAMLVDFESERFEANLSGLPNKKEIYTKLFPVYDDRIIDGEEGLSISDLYRRINEFFKNPELVVVNLNKDMTGGAFSHFSNKADIFVVKNCDPKDLRPHLYSPKFNMYRLRMRYSDTCSALISKHMSISDDFVTEIFTKSMNDFYSDLGLSPDFVFEAV